MPFIKNLRSTARLSHEDGKVMDMLIKELKVKKYIVLGKSLACSQFYKGCGCELCKSTENLGAHNYPKVGPNNG